MLMYRMCTTRTAIELSLTVANLRLDYSFNSELPETADQS